MLNVQQRRKAACRGLDTGLWYPDHGDDGTAARAICRTCPVRTACLTAAVASGEQYGIYGGAGESARRPLRRAWRVGGIAWDIAIANHWERIDNPDSANPMKSFGLGATHGRRVTHSRGCRCDLCLITPAIGDSWLKRLPIREK